MLALNFKIKGLATAVLACSLMNSCSLVRAGGEAVEAESATQRSDDLSFSGSGDYVSPNSEESNSSTESPAANGPLEGQPLILDTEQLIDDDGIGQLSFQWQVQDSTGLWRMAEQGASQSFTPRQAHVGKPLRAKIEFLDGQGTLETIITPATGPVQNVNNPPTGNLTLRGLAQEDETLQIDATSLFDADGIGSLNYSWERSSDGVTWVGFATNSNDPSLLRIQQQQVGYRYRGSVSYRDRYGSFETVTTSPSAVAKNLDDPAIGSLIISGRSAVGQTQNLDISGISDEDGIASINATWQISSDGVNWQSGSDVRDRQLQLKRSHVGKMVRAQAIVVDNFGNQSIIYSSVSKPVENVNSKPRGVVKITTVN